MPHLGITEVLLILVIILVLFGGGKISGLGREAGQFIANFRKQLNSNDPS